MGEYNEAILPAERIVILAAGSLIYLVFGKANSAVGVHGPALRVRNWKNIRRRQVHG